MKADIVTADSLDVLLQKRHWKMTSGQRTLWRFANKLTFKIFSKGIILFQFYYTFCKSFNVIQLLNIAIMLTTGNSVFMAGLA